MSYRDHHHRLEAKEKWRAPTSHLCAENLVLSDFESVESITYVADTSDESFKEKLKPLKVPGVVMHHSLVNELGKPRVRMQRSLPGCLFCL